MIYVKSLPSGHALFAADHTSDVRTTFCQHFSKPCTKTTTETKSPNIYRTRVRFKSTRYECQEVM